MKDHIYYLAKKKQGSVSKYLKVFYVDIVLLFGREWGKGGVFS